MTKLYVLFGLLFLINISTFAQKFGYVDTQYVLGRMSEYSEAQGEIQKLAQSWEKEIQGLYFLKKKELIKPVQDQVFEAVERVAKNNRLQIVFDKSGDLVMIYTDPIHDYTDFVLDELGLGENEEEEN